MSSSSPISSSMSSPMSWSGASTSSPLRQPPLRPLGRWCTPRFKNLKHETQKQEYFTITQVPLPCVPLLPSDISIWNLGSPARHQRGHWQQQRWRQGGVQRQRGPCEVPSTSSLQRLLLSRVLCKVISVITIIKITHMMMMITIIKITSIMTTITTIITTAPIVSSVVSGE